MQRLFRGITIQHRIADTDQGRCGTGQCGGFAQTVNFDQTGTFGLQRIGPHRMVFGGFFRDQFGTRFSCGGKEDTAII